MNERELFAALMDWLEPRHPDWARRLRNANGDRVAAQEALRLWMASDRSVVLLAPLSVLDKLGIEHDDCFDDVERGLAAAVGGLLYRRVRDGTREQN